VGHAGAGYRSDGIQANPGSGTLDLQDIHQADQAGLRCAVVGLAELAVQAGG